MKLNIPSLALLAMMTGQVAADLTCVGDCAPTSVDGSEDCFILTPAENNKVGAVWAGQAADITTDFNVTASLYFGNKDDGADGIAFVIQNVLGNAAVGKDGGRLGFLDIGEFFAVDVDTYFNHNLQQEEEQDHAFISSANGGFGASAVVNNGANIEDGAWYDFVVSWVAETPETGVMSVSFGGNVVMTRTGLSIKDELGGATTAYFGFTAATGGFNNLQQICDVVVPGDVTGEVTATTVAPEVVTAAPAAVSLIPAECEDFAVFGTTAITFAATNTVNGGNAGTNTIGGITGPAITQESPFTKVDGPVDATIDCAAAIAAAVDAFQAATPGGNYTTFATATLQDKSPIKPGSYYSEATLSTAADDVIVFDAEGDPNAIFILQAESTLGTGARTKFTLINEAKAENIYWQIGTAATIGAGTAGVGHSFVGTIIAGTAINVGADVTMYGRLLAETAVTMGASNIVDPFGVVVPPSARFLRH